MRTVRRGGLASACVSLTSSALLSCLSRGLSWLLQKLGICFIFPCVLIGLELESRSGLPGLFSQEPLGEMLCFRLPRELGGKPLSLLYLGAKLSCIQVCPGLWAGGSMLPS